MLRLCGAAWVQMGVNGGLYKQHEKKSGDFSPL